MFGRLSYSMIMQGKGFFEPTGAGSDRGQAVITNI